MTVYPNTSTRVEDAAGIRGTDVDDEIKVERYTAKTARTQRLGAESVSVVCALHGRKRSRAEERGCGGADRTLLPTIMSDYMSGESDVSGATRSCRREQLAESGVEGQVLKDHWSESFPTSGG